MSLWLEKRRDNKRVWDVEMARVSFPNELTELMFNLLHNVGDRYEKNYDTTDGYFGEDVEKRVPFIYDMYKEVWKLYNTYFTRGQEAHISPVKYSFFSKHNSRLCHKIVFNMDFIDGGDMPVRAQSEIPHFTIFESVLEEWKCLLVPRVILAEWFSYRPVYHSGEMIDLGGAEYKVWVNLPRCAFAEVLRQISYNF